MLNIHKFAAIDIGSNAVRLLISHVVESANHPPTFRKYSLTRLPIRLGEDSFIDKKISAAKIKKLTEAMNAFTILMRIHEIQTYRACATSAMRDAENKLEVITYIKNNTGIDIEIINENDEANIIALNPLHSFMNQNNNYLYVDVGGGSTEFTIYSKSKKIISKSFKVGTVRLLNNIVSDGAWQEIEDWITTNTKNLKNIILIGSGGNINKIFKDSEIRRDKPMSYEYLKNYYEKIKDLSYEEKIITLNMNYDRADVISHATFTFMKSMEFAKTKKIYVSEIGLTDGIIRSMYKNSNT